ncbi:Hsp33 family molecular chaperone HslO [bacterium]|nr:Hsp33 family molecular chaperone HslO [bacterium]
MTKTADRWVKCISTAGNVRGVGIQATELVRSMVETHDLDPVGSQGLGEAVMGALLLASYCKPGERINLNIQGSKNFRQALVDAYPDGRVRGYVIQREFPTIADPENPNAGPWGTGLLSVLRTKDQVGQQPYIGTVPLVTGHLAKDLAFYWTQSEQVPSAVGLAVEMKDGKVQTAGGFLIQALPGATDREIRSIESHIREIHDVAREFATNPDPLSLISKLMQDEAFMVVEEQKLQFKCQCSRDRVERALALVGVAELQSMIEEDKKATIRCDFCTKVYDFSLEQLESMVAQAKQ